MTLAIHFTSKELHPRAESLSQTLHLPITSTPTDYDYLLYLTPTYLGLKKSNSKTLPLYVNFLSPQMQFREHHASLKKERLAKALGLKKNTSPTIIDATGGLGRDSFILACLGFNVTILERSPIIHAILQDGIERARGKIPAIDRLSLIHANAITWLPNIQADIIYLDPMFEERKKSARPKKEMLIFHDIIGNDEDAAPLLSTALSCANERVVVKRSRLAQPLNEIIPSYSLSGSSCRFDIYLTREK